MTATQPLLDLSQRAVRKKAGPNLAARMIAILTHAGFDGWMTRKQFAYFTIIRDGNPESDRMFTDRACRLGRECSHGRIIRGQKGYKLLRLATLEEYVKSMAAWTAQIKAEQEQYSMTAKRWHGGNKETK